MEDDLIILENFICIDTAQLKLKKKKQNLLLCYLECFQTELYLNEDHHSML